MAKTTKTQGNIFANATVVGDKPKANGKKAKVEVEVPGIAEYAAFNAIVDTVKGLQESVRPDINNALTDRFVSEALKLQRQPDNFSGVEGLASASCQLKKRSSVSALNDEQVQVLEDNNIPYDTVADRPDTFIFGEAYIGNAKIMGVVNDALAPLVEKGKLPADLIQRQEATTKRVVSDDTLTAVFKITDEDTLRLILPVVTTLAVKPTTEEDIVSCVARLIRHLSKDKEQAARALHKALDTIAEAA